MYAQKAAGNPQGFLSRLFSGNNKFGYRDTYNKTGGFMGFGGQNDVRFNPVTQRYEFEEEETGDVKPGRSGQILGGLASLFTGIPFVGSAIGSGIDRFKSQPKDMSSDNQLGLFGQPTNIENPNRTERYDVDKTPMDSLSLNNFNRQIPEEEIDIQETFQPSYNGGITDTDSFTSSDGLGIYDGS